MMQNRIIVTLALVYTVSSVAALSAQVRSAQTMYADANAQEQAVRQALVEPNPSATVLKAVRTVVAAYEAVVTRYPTSGYCDDALWYAGQLSIDAFRLFGEAREQTAANRLLGRLASQYPSSKFVAQVDGVLASLGPALPTVPAEDRSAPAAVRTASSRNLPTATIRNIRRDVLPDGVRVTIELDREVPFHDEQIPNPTRVFVDLPATRASAALLDRTLRFDDEADLVRQIRIGRHPNNTTRVVLDANGLASYSVYPMYSPFRLVIDCLRKPATAITLTANAAAANPAPTSGPAIVTPAATDASETTISARPIAPAAERTLPAASSQKEAAIAQARTAMRQPLPAAATAPAANTAGVVTAPPARNLAGGFSVARQLGLAVSRIVIDPGHGGHDPGAVARGVSESDLVLDVAQRLEKLLADVPGVEVILTRRSDEFIPLQERTALANREGADLFLSIHANASNNTQARGVETYFLNFTTNQNAAAVAARENAASGQAMSALPELLKTIAQHSKRDESRDLATYIQRGLVERMKPANKTLRDLGVKQAPFVVLIGASMPSVLAEISFVTNAQEARLLKTASYRQRIAEGLFAAVRRYQSSLKAETKVAQQ
jgi:N-acetylmuramoyl-L-alanine amidase